MTYIPNGMGKGWSLGKQYVPRAVCPVCNREFYCPPSQMRRAKGKIVCCSMTCRGLRQRKIERARPILGKRGKKMRQLTFDLQRFRNQKGPKIQRFCLDCGKHFEVVPAIAKKGQGIYCSRRCFAKHSPIHKFKYTRAGSGGKRADLGQQYFRSRWEANWARYLNWRKERGEIAGWKFEAKTFEFPVKRGSKFYTPDFLIIKSDGSEYFEEVKGYMDAPSATKLKRMRIHYPEVRVEVIDAPIYKQAHKQLSRLIPHWEMPGSNHAF